MKNLQDPRHLRRVQMVKRLFAYSFSPLGVDISTIQPLLKKIDRLDKIIGVAAPEWPIAKINKIDLSIMRLAVFELLENKEPTKVVIDEAVELAKQYGSDKSYKFINGALGTIVKNNLLTAKL